MNWTNYKNTFSVHPNSQKLIDNFNCPFRLDRFGGVCDFIIGEVEGYIVFVCNKSNNGRELGPVSVMHSKDCLEPDCRWVEKWGEYVYQL